VAKGTIKVAWWLSWAFWFVMGFAAGCLAAAYVTAPKAGFYMMPKNEKESRLQSLSSH
jgi:hypothetical protein